MKKIAFLLIVSLFLTASMAMAADKIAYIDLQKILIESNEGKTAKDTIAQKVKSLDAKIKGEQKKLQALKTDLEKQGVLLAPEAKAQKEREYQKKLKDFQRLAKDSQDQLRQEDAEFTRRILKEVLQVVRDMGKKDAYTLILEKQESSVIYADQAINITDKVIAAYNASKKK